MPRVPQIPGRSVTCRVAMRWGDMDALGHLNNVTFLALFEQARVQFLEAAGLWDEGTSVLVARNEIDYLRPLRYTPVPLEIRTWVDRIGTSSFTFAYVMLDPADGGVVASAKTVVVSIDPVKGSAAPIPKELRDRLAEFLAD